MKRWKIELTLRNSQGSMTGYILARDEADARRKLLVLHPAGKVAIDPLPVGESGSKAPEPIVQQASVPVLNQEGCGVRHRPLPDPSPQAEAPHFLRRPR